MPRKKEISYDLDYRATLISHSKTGTLLVQDRHVVTLNLSDFCLHFLLQQKCILFKAEIFLKNIKIPPRVLLIRLTIKFLFLERGVLW